MTEAGQRGDSLDPVRAEYARRTERFDSFTADERRMFDRLMERRHRQYDRLLRETGLLPLADRRVLDVGSGRNEWLVACRQQWGHTGGELCGIDLLEERVERGLAEFPDLDLRAGSADALPWPDEYFDLVHQGMLLTSILDEGLRRKMVAEMRRVTRPGGHLLWYDFVWNPINRHAQGISAGQISREYFPNWRVVASRRVTLVPPLARLLLRLGEPLVDLAESLRALNFWHLALLEKPRT